MLDLYWACCRTAILTIVGNFNGLFKPKIFPEFAKNRVRQQSLIDDIPGVDPILTRSYEGIPVVLLGWHPLEHYFDTGIVLKETFKHLRIVFRRLPIGKQEILEAISEATIE